MDIIKKMLWKREVLETIGFFCVPFVNGNFKDYPPWNQQLAPENMPSQKEISSSNHPFSVDMLVFWGSTLW